MRFKSPRTMLMIAAAIVATSAAAFVTMHSQAGAVPKAPPLSAAGTKKLAMVDRDLGFYLARLNSAPTDGGRVAEVVEQWIHRGKLTGDGADFDSALVLVDKAEALVRNDPRLPAARAHVLWARHRFVEARSVATEALKRFPDDERLTAIAADSALYAGDMDAGATIYRHLSELSPRTSVPWIGLAYWAEVSGDLEQAVDLLGKAIDAGYPKPLGYERQAYVHAVLGEVRAKQGDLKEARRQFLWALSKAPDYASARTGLSDVEQWEGNDAAAEALLRKLIETESPNADYQVKLADLLDRHGRQAEAAALRKTAETYYEWSVATGFDGYLRPLATIKLAEGDYVRAAELAARDLEIRPTTESRAIYQNVLAQAAAAGRPLDATALRRILPRKPVELSRS